MFTVTENTSQAPNNRSPTHGFQGNERGFDYPQGYTSMCSESDKYMRISKDISCKKNVVFNKKNQININFVKKMLTVKNNGFCKNSCVKLFLFFLKKKFVVPLVSVN